MASAAIMALAAAGLVAVAPPATAATTLRCRSEVIGVLPNGTLVERSVTNRRVDVNSRSDAPLPYRVQSLVPLGSESITGGYKAYYTAFVNGTRPRDISATHLDGKTTSRVRTVRRLPSRLAGRIVAGSGRYYLYAVDKRGRMVRWTRFTDGKGGYWLASPVLIASGVGGLRTLSYGATYKAPGIRADVLYGTAESGALIQFQIRWNNPSNVTVTLLRKRGFDIYDGLSLGACNQDASHLALFAVDRASNRLIWFDLTDQFHPQGSNLTRDGSVGRGVNWRLHAVM